MLRNMLNDLAEAIRRWTEKKKESTIRNCKGFSNSRWRFISEFLHVDFFRSCVVIHSPVVFKFGFFVFDVCFGDKRVG